MTSRCFLPIFILTLAISSAQASGDVLCGTVMVSGRGETLLQYRTGEPYGSNKTCIWTIEANTTFQANVQIRVISKSLQSGNTLTIQNLVVPGTQFIETRVGGEGSLTTFGVSSMTLLIFSSDGTTPETGFEVAFRFSAISTTAKIPYTITTGDPSQGTLKYPTSGTYAPNARFAVVLHNGGTVSSSTIEHFVDFLDTQSSKDLVNYYEIRNDGYLNPQATLSGSVPNPQLTPFLKTTYPSIIIFSSDASVSGRGFEITWQPQPYKRDV